MGTSFLRRILFVTQWLELKFYKQLGIKRKELIRETKAHAGVRIKRTRAVRRLQFEVHPQRRYRTSISTASRV